MAYYITKLRYLIEKMVINSYKLLNIEGIPDSIKKRKGRDKR